MTTFEIIGQILGGVAIILGFASYQMKTQDKLIFVHTLTTFVFVLQYLFMGAIPGMALNIVSMIRGIVYYFRNKKGSNDKITPIIFAVLMGITGIITWDNWYSVFIFLALIINTLCMSLSDPQKVRISLLVTCPLALIYDALLPVPAVTAIVFELFSITSAIIGLVRNKKKA